MKLAIILGFLFLTLINPIGATNVPSHNHQTKRSRKAGHATLAVKADSQDPAPKTALKPTVKLAFDPADPATWPTCPTGDIVRADNGQCAAPATAAPSTTVQAHESCSAYDSLFRQYSWDVSVAEAICQAESGGNPNAVSSTDDYGLLQIHQGLEIYGSAIFDPAFNIKIAYTVKYLGNYWRPWSTYLSGAYLKYL